MSNVKNATNVKKGKISKTSAAAYKAWETRRANAAKAKRSAAAKKAAATRRANAVV